ncbi:hypothetical protein EDD86DRAFT_145725 [Gorgonomyces haynaldii]|nr:hypothetical protein EDD86DRAFT_145725 [Gorgonomyces haynaldii]
MVDLMTRVHRNRDLADIIRDNSMSTMLLTSFARLKGEAYLIVSLTQPLNAILPMLDNCDVDMSKINMLDPEQLQELEKNRNRLQKACDILFNHLFENQKRMPEGMQRMSSFLQQLVLDISATRAHLSSPDFAKEDKQRKHRSWSIVDQEQPKQEVEVELVPLKDDKAKVSRSMTSHAKLKSTEKIAVPKPPEVGRSKTKMEPKPKVLIQEQSPDKQDSPSPTHQQLTTRALGILTTVQKVVGAFLFLRFFVPGNKINGSSHIARYQCHPHVRENHIITTQRTGACWKTTHCLVQ